MRSFFRVSIGGLMVLVLVAALGLAALRFPTAAMGTFLVWMALTFLFVLSLFLAGVVTLAWRFVRRGRGVRDRPPGEVGP